MLEFWESGPYQNNTHNLSNALGHALSDDLLETGLFRRDGESLGFIHDSLVYYFAGKLALRDYLGPGSPMTDEEADPAWRFAVAERVATTRPRGNGLPSFWAGRYDHRNRSTWQRCCWSSSPREHGMACAISFFG